MTDRLIELSHLIEDGTITYRGLPPPRICDFWTREASAANYADGATFQIGRIDMVANTGTYVDVPFHRYAGGEDLADVGVGRLADLPALRISSTAQAVDADAFAELDSRGKAVLVHTGWDRHWGSAAYFEDHPFLTEAAARLLVEQGAALVGIDSHNIDDTRAPRRPVHRLLLGAGIPICEHLTNLAALPPAGFRFTAAPPRLRGMGSFPVRAFARLE